MASLYPGGERQHVQDKGDQSKMAAPAQQQQSGGESNQQSSSNLSDLVKDMVKEMDGDEFYSTTTDLYDESAEEHWFNIDITLEPDGEGLPAGEGPPPPVHAASLRKPWSEFQRLHYLLLADEFGCDEAVKEKLPALPARPPSAVTRGGVAGISSCGSGGGGGGGGGGSGSTDGSFGSSVNSSSSAELAQGLDAYLKALLAVPAVIQSQVFSGFLEEHSRRRRHRSPNKDDEEKESGGDGSAGACSAGEEARKSPETAIDFLLQPFEYGRAYVPRRAEHTESIDVLRGESVVWKFEVLDHLDIDFSVTFRPHPLAASSRRPPEAGEDGGRPPTAEEEEEDCGVLDADADLPRSPGPRGVGSGGVAASSANGDGGSTEAGRKRSRWWGRSGGCEGAAGGADGGTGGGGVNAPKGETVHLPTRYSTGSGDPVQGSFSCPAAGTCILRWDNAFSRLRGKRLCFVFESVTVQTMQAAIEAAGAADHKRRAARSAAAQTILDSGRGEVQVCVTAVGAADDYDGSEEDGKEGSHDGGYSASAESSDAMYYSSLYRFGRVRRVVAGLLRDLGGMVDVTRASGGINGAAIAESGGGGSGSGSSVGSAFDVGRGTVERGDRYGNVNAEGVAKLVAQFELLEDEVASVSARRAQSEAQAKVLLANLQKSNARTDRLGRSLEETREDLSTVRETLRETETARDEAAAAAAEASAGLQTSEEQLLRARRQHDLLQAERSVWHVARSGIQEELAKVVAELEQERHRHEDTSRALAKSHESRAHAEAEAARLSRRLEEERGGAGGARAALAAEREASRLAREEAEDARTAVAELDAAVAELGAQKRVLVAGLRARERALGDRCAGAEARAEEAAMMRRAAEARVRELEEEAERREAAQADGEVRLQRLRAEKKVLLAEVRRGAGGDGGGAASGVSAGGDGRKESEGGGSLGGLGGDDARGREGAGGGSGGSSCRGSLSPRSSGKNVQDNKAALKQLSRQLVNLRERQHHLREDLRADPSNSSALRLEADVDRAVQNLEMRIRRLLSIVSGGGDEDDSSTSSSPPGPTYRKGDASPVENQGAAAAAAAAAATTAPTAAEAEASAVEVERHSV